MNKAAGFTLIEMLVSTVLLSAIVLVGSSSYSIFSKRWDGQLGKFDQTLQDVRDVMLVDSVLDSLIPYVTYDHSETPVLYFEGNRNGFVTVSAKSVFSEKIPAVVRFSVVQREDLSFDVIYEEWPMENNVLRSTYQNFNFAQPITLFESVTSPNFEYFGWESVIEREGFSGAQNAVPARWLSSLNSLEERLLPERIRLSFYNNGEYKEINTIIAAQRSNLLTRFCCLGPRQRNGLGEPIKSTPSCTC